MRKLFRRRSKKVGVPPGTLIYTGDAPNRTSSLKLVLYSADTFIELQPATINEAFDLQQNGHNAWLHVAGVADAQLIHDLGARCHLHPLLLEDIMNPYQRAKLDDYKEHLFLALHLLTFKENGEVELIDEQLSMVLGKNLLITFLDKENKFLNPIYERLRNPISKVRQRGVDYLAYGFLDLVVDHYFLILERSDDEIAHLEDELFAQTQSPTVVRTIQRLKREVALLRKTIWPMRELINQFRRTESPLVTESTKVYLYDVYDHTVQAIDTIEGFRDILSGMLDIYLSTINQKTNEIMKVLTMVATIFVPLTFITSLYGMNFEHMPALHNPIGFPVTVCLMASISLGMLWFFHRRHWI